jgi:archaemetzincin
MRRVYELLHPNPRYWIYFFLLLFVSCQQKEQHTSIVEECYELKALTKKKHPTQTGEWRASFTEIHEPLKNYASRNPTRATHQRNKLFVVAIGPFDEKGNEILTQTKAYLKAFYQIEVSTLPAIPLSSIPEKYSRENDYGLQWRTSIILDSLLPSLLPDSAFALIAFTTSDLYPDEKWNYVFGQASLGRRVGVWSLSRLGKYNDGTAAYAKCLKRTLKIATHETGHIFGIQHCVQNECCMNGGNSLEESDEQPDWFCWECLAKICWNRNVHPSKQIEALLRFHEATTKDNAQIQYYKQALKLLSDSSEK